MNIIETFQSCIEAYLIGKTIKLPQAATNSQKRYLFGRELKSEIQKLENEFSRQADNWSKLTGINGLEDDQNLRPQLTNVIRTVLRNYKYEQEEKSGLFD